MVAALLCSLCFAGGSQTQTPPNVVLILLDDAGFGTYGPFGPARDYATPHIDSLARDGVSLPSFYANAPVCSPSRAALLTGLYPQRFGFWRALPQDSERSLPPESRTLAEGLRERGYSTGHVGKWHLGHSRPDDRPDRHGFDEFVLFSSDVARSTHYSDPTLTRTDGSIERREGHLTTVLTDCALDFIQRNRNRRFFLNLWYRAPHARCAAPAAWAAKFEDTEAGRFAALMSHVDAQIGRLLTALDELELDDDTLVLIFGDNGSVPSIAERSGLRGAKASLLEAGVRAPLIARWRGVLEPGRVVTETAYAFDLAPTLTGLAGGELAADGVDILHTLKDGLPPLRAAPVFFEVKATNSRRSVENYQSYAIRKGRWKLLGTGPQTALFDLEQDGEKTDHSDQHPELIRELLAQRRRWRLEISTMELGLGEPPSSVSVLDGSWSFGAAAEPWSGHESSSWRIDDGDLSVRIVFRAADAGRDVTLAEVPDSWRLDVTQRGTVRIRVNAPDGRFVVLQSKQITTDGSRHDVAFTLSGMKLNSTALALYVDGRREAQSWLLPRLAIGASALVVGGAEDERRYRGRIDSLDAWQCSLEPAELEELAQRDGTLR